MERIRRKLARADNGNRQMAEILAAVLTDGLPQGCLRESAALNQNEILASIGFCPRRLGALCLHRYCCHTKAERNDRRNAE
jgi:hypothetical protein